MYKLTASLILVALVFARGAVAQPVQIVETIPSEDAAGVPLMQRVTFRLNKPTPATSSAFVNKFFWTPEVFTQVGLFGHDFDENDELTLVFFELTHTADTDFAWVVYGVEAEDGSRMARPFTLNYSTAPTRGDRRISGTVEIAADFPTAAVPAAREAQRERGVRLSGLFSQRTPADAPEARARALSPAVAEALAGTPRTTVVRSHPVSATSIDRSAVVLLSDFALNTAFWIGHVATVPALDGTYELDGVRPGTYYPVVISYATEEGEQIGAYGYYDADGDFSPDPVTVSAGSDLADIDLTLYSFASSTALESLTLASSLAGDIAADRRLLEVQALAGVDQAGSVFPDGTAYEWLYTFYSPSSDELIYVTVGPIQASSFVEPAPSGTAAQAPLASLEVDSDEALSIADANGGNAFRESFANPEAVTVTMGAGALDFDPRPAGGAPFWAVTYTAPENDPSDDVLVVFIDPSTGAVLDPVPVANEPASWESLGDGLVVFPNPVREAATASFALDASEDLRLELLDLQGRRVATLAEGTFSRGTHRVSFAGATHALPSGTYILRLHGSSLDRSRLLVLLN